MRRSALIAIAAVTAISGTVALAPAPVGAQLQNQTTVAPANDLPNPYLRIEPWGDIPTGAWSERSSFIGAEEGPDGNLYFLGRCFANSCTDRPEPPVLKLDPSGKLLASWGSGEMDFPHGFDIDDQGNVYAADQRGHRILKWSADGELLMTIGQRGTAGDPPRLLSEPTDVVVASNGDILITEGHSFSQGANRVSKFSSDGTFIMSWGKTGSGPGEFNVPHAIALDSRERVFVGDRGNNRIQIFDLNGTFMDVWYQFSRPSGIAIGADDRIYVADSESYGVDNPAWRKGIRVGSAVDGSVQYLIEDLESTTVEHSGAEGVGVDSNGNVYGAVVRRRMLERHVPGGAAARGMESAAATTENPHVGHVTKGFGQTPGGRGLLVTASADAGIAMLHANFAAANLSDLAAMQRHAGHVLHALEPAAGSRGPGTGFGIVNAAGQVARHIQMAAEAPGASSSLRTHAGHIASVARTVEARAQRAAVVARELQTATSMAVASPLVAELRLLTYQIAEGGDLDRDGTLGLEGEAGLQQLEAHAYLLLKGEGLPVDLQ